MKLTWYGQSNFGVEYEDAKILTDPFFFGPYEDPAKQKEIWQGTTHVLLTHGHDDHIGASVEICKATGAMLVANYELCNYLAGQGIPEEQINRGNHGGTLDCGGFTVTLVNAVHSSSSKNSDGTNVFLGNPTGLVLHGPNEKTLYHMGDTDIFGDMALINELHQPQVGIVPVGDRFTMGGAVAALACKRYFDFDAIIPCHYGSFPILDQTADRFVGAMEEAASLVHVMEVGTSAEF